MKNSEAFCRKSSNRPVMKSKLVALRPSWFQRWLTLELNNCLRYGVMYHMPTQQWIATFLRRLSFVFLAMSVRWFDSFNRYLSHYLCLSKSNEWGEWMVSVIQNNRENTQCNEKPDWMVDRVETKCAIHLETSRYWTSYLYLYFFSRLETVLF